ncbi:hypothetical protein F53441_158 [Fusarium austroafricanum]|uniref:Uncharacterized protein n=1 Tax=Fusarium austroafricanum TaxID=2364996 RepID=A0A8H4KYM0_9HYPO|nr:hypothetical protein F53441_158 [Fusarium austroafricanum]
MAEGNEIETGQTVPAQGFSPETTNSGAPANDSQDEPTSQKEPPYPNAPVTESPLARETAETYRDYREARKQHDHKWWRDGQFEPGLSDPDRQFIITDPEAGETNPLGSHLRPTTPLLERAEKHVQDLRDQGVEVLAERVKEIFDHFTTNSGLYASLMEWCEGTDAVPIEHVREIVKMLDRLKLEMGKQMRDATERGNKKDNEYKFLRQQYEQLRREKDNRDREIKSQVQTKRQRRYSMVEFRQTRPQPTEFSELMDRHTRTVMTNIERGKKAKRLEEKVDSLEKENKELRISGKEEDIENWKKLQEEKSEKRKIKVAAEKAERDLEVENGQRKETEQEIEMYKDFHQTVYAKLTNHFTAWTLVKRTVDQMAKDDKEVSKETTVVIREVTKGWEQLRKSFETEWLPSKAAIETKWENLARIWKRTSNTGTMSWNFSVMGKGKQKEATSPKESPRPDSIPPSTRIQIPETSLDAARQAQNSETSDKKDEAKRLERELQANIEIDGLKEQVQERNTRIKTLEEQIQTKADINKLAKLNEQGEGLKKEVESLKKQAISIQNRIKALEKVNFATPDGLINAVRDQENGRNGTEELGLVDRINYLNLACFFRTRNYVQLAFREGADRSANILLYDASKWIKFFQEDFAKMDGSVYAQLKASMGILDGVRRILTAKDEDAGLRGRRDLRDGQEALSGFPDTSPFMQLEQLADSIIEATQDNEDKILYNKRLRFSFQKGFRVEGKPKANVQERLRNDRSMETEELRRSGFHSPLSPENWEKNSPDERFGLEDISE